MVSAPSCGGTNPANSAAMPRGFGAWVREGPPIHQEGVAGTPVAESGM